MSRTERASASASASLLWEAGGVRVPSAALAPWPPNDKNKNKKPDDDDDIYFLFFDY